MSPYPLKFKYSLGSEQLSHIQTSYEEAWRYMRWLIQQKYKRSLLMNAAFCLKDIYPRHTYIPVLLAIPCYYKTFSIYFSSTNLFLLIFEILITRIINFSSRKCRIPHPVAYQVILILVQDYLFNHFFNAHLLPVLAQSLVFSCLITINSLLSNLCLAGLSILPSTIWSLNFFV